jgi:hypothetical protein
MGQNSPEFPTRAETGQSYVETTHNLREEILAAIRRLVDPATGRPPSMTRLLAHLGLSQKRYYRCFASHGAAVAAAGLDYHQPNATCTAAQLLAAYGVAVRSCGKLPSQPEFWAATRHHSATLIRRTGTWADAPAAFLAFAGDDPQWADAVAIVRRELPRHEAFRRLRCRQRNVAPRSGDFQPPDPHSADPAHPAGCAPSGLADEMSGGRAAAAPGPLCGAPLGVPGLAFCPVNEAGVVVLFALLAVRLGFNIVAVQTAFPDCLAQREVAPGRWQLVRIEFEYESRNFADHRHPAADCDLLVCWRHNWPDCPPGLEVLELEGEV